MNAKRQRGKQTNNKQTLFGLASISGKLSNLYLSLKPNLGYVVAGSTFNLSKKVCPATLSTLAVLLLFSFIYVPEFTHRQSTFADTQSTNSDTIAISVEPLNLVVSPTAEGAFSSATTQVSVTSASGYTLSMNTATTSTDLIYSSDAAKKIASTAATKASPVTATTMAVNTWGLSTDVAAESNKNFYAAPNSDSTEEDKLIVDTDTSSGTELHDITLGAKVDLSNPAGAYGTTLIFSAIAKAAPGPVCNPNATSIDAAVCMQDINDTVIASMVNNKQYQLYDIRDEKQYYIAKLADGNVWMTQNLDFDLVAGEALTPDTSDVDASWDPLVSTSQNISDFNFEHYATRSFDPQDTYYVNSGSTSDDTEYTSFESCVSAGKTAELCAHSHAGNYYNWYAATAGAGNADVSLLGEEVNSSICPAGWTLPSASSNAGAISFYNLLTANGLSLDEYGYIDDSAASLTLRNSPLYFVRSGDVYDGDFGRAGYGGGYWSSTVNGGDDAYNLDFNSGYVGAQYSWGRGGGLSVRCLARSGTAWSLSYDSGVVDADVPSRQTAPGSAGAKGHEFTISSTILEAEGREFLGWSTFQDPFSYWDESDVVNYLYQPGDIIVAQSNHPDITLYAIWSNPVGADACANGEPTYLDALDGPLSMQQFGALTQAGYMWDLVDMGVLDYGVSSCLYDERDDKLYNVTLMDDDNVWMTQNLDFNIEGELAYDMGEDYTGILDGYFGIYEYAHGTDLPVNESWNSDDEFNTLYDVGDWEDDYKSAVSFDPGDWFFSGNPESDEDCYYLDGTCDDFSPEPYETNGWHGHVGNYYNYSAATAGSGLGLAAEDAPESICPAGWKLASISNYQELLGGFEGGPDEPILLDPFYFVRSGYAYSGRLNNAGSEGDYWSSSAGDSGNYAYNLGFYSGYVNALGYGGLYGGLSVRCLARTE